jgi:general transcriptional corepressor CYC8
MIPNDPVFYTSLAVLLYNMGYINQSFEQISHASSLQHQLPEIWYNLGILYETCKQPDEALIAYDMVMSVDP